MLQYMVPTVYNIYLLQSSLRAERGNVRANVAVSLCRDLFQVHVIVQLHVLSVDPQDLQSTCEYGVGGEEPDDVLERWVLFLC